MVDVEKFYLGRKKLDLHNDEIIAEILLPKAGIDDYYYKKGADATRWPSPVFRLRAFSAGKRHHHALFRRVRRGGRHGAALS